MISDLLDLPVRTLKPRTRGMTMVIDPGLPSSYFCDAVESAGEYIDVVKFGWGTSLVTPTFERKIECLRHHGIRYYFGGTLFEKFVIQDRLEGYLEWCRHSGADLIEVSNGTIPMSNTAKVAYIRKCAEGFTVISEVGFKDSDRSDRLDSSQWVDYIHEDLEAGSSLVITEARESGRSGICQSDGQIRSQVIDDILDSGVDRNKLCFEAPSKDLQTYFISRLGANVNVGNIALSDVIGLETLRLGLRGDTLMHFEEECLRHA